MKQRAAAFVVGFLFALGLAVGGMTDPRKVIAFLDFAGDWDPSLAFVMGGAILVYAPLFRLGKRRKAPLFGDAFHLPTRKDIDSALVVGATLFGVGWGLGGFCPGPGLVATVSLGTSAVVFTVSMLAGMAAFSLGQQLRGRS